MQRRLFPMLEEEIGEITEKMQEFLRIIKLVKPSRFIDGVLSWCGLGCRLKKRENLLRAYFLKPVYDLPTTKVLIENLIRNSTWSQLCAWETFTSRKSKPYGYVYSHRNQNFLAKNTKNHARIGVLKLHHNKVFTHLMFGVIAITAKQLFNSR